MPPIDFGVAWRHVGIHRRYGHELSLWLCPDAPQAWHDAYRAARAQMTGAGYSWTSCGTPDGTMTVCWWDTGIAFDRDALVAEVGRVVAVAAANRAERARREEERLAAEIAEVAPAAALIRKRLAGLLRDRPWALGRHLTEARELAGMSDWTRHGLRAAHGHLSNAKGNVERAAERLNRIPPALWFAKADDERIRAAALEACRHLSSLDEDWASERNSSGWSQATCWSGHLLSEKPTFDQGEAAHALGLLHSHRRQLPDELALVLFGEVFSRRRSRAAPAAAPSLGL